MGCLPTRTRAPQLGLPRFPPFRLLAPSPSRQGQLAPDQLHSCPTATRSWNQGPSELLQAGPVLSPVWFLGAEPEMGTPVERVERECSQEQGSGGSRKGVGEGQETKARMWPLGPARSHRSHRISGAGRAWPHWPSPSHPGSVIGCRPELGAECQRGVPGVVGPAQFSREAGSTSLTGPGEKDPGGTPTAATVLAGSPHAVSWVPATDSPQLIFLQSCLCSTRSWSPHERGLLLHGGPGRGA